MIISKLDLLYRAQLDLILDPHDPDVVAAAQRDGVPADWIAAAVSTVSQNACTETRGAGAMWSSEAATSTAAGSSNLAACLIICPNR